MSNNFKPSETMMKSQENKDGHAPRFSHCHRNSQRSVHPHFWWWFWRVLRHHPTLYKDTQPKKQTWNPKLADLQMFLQRWGEFSGPFSGSIYVCFFKGGCSSITWTTGHLGDTPTSSASSWRFLLNRWFAFDFKKRKSSRCSKKLQRSGFTSPKVPKPKIEWFLVLIA